MTKFTDEFNALIRQFEELCKREGVVFFGDQLEGEADVEEVAINVAWKWGNYDSDDEDCEGNTTYSIYWQDSRC